ncbi:glycosyltransferase [Candidatus Dojkabacteria bacterium]|nr:glycosyltransferase [Candidatus Dojkabacteria bacterium]
MQKTEVFTKKDKILYWVLIATGIFLVSTFAFYWFSPTNIPNNYFGLMRVFDIFVFLLVSYVVWYQILNEIFFWFVLGKMKTPVFTQPEKGLRVAFLTAFVPSKEPLNLLQKCLRAIKSVDYKHDTWVLDEGNDENVKRFCKKVGAFHFTRNGISKYNQAYGKYKARTKAGNYNAWFSEHSHEYDIVAQVDVDFIPNKSFLTKTLGYFKDPEVAFVGTPQVYGNTIVSWIAKGAAQQAYGFYGVMQRGFFGLDMQLFIGANHIVRVKSHNDINGYFGHIVEDHITGMQFYSKKWKSVYVPEILAIGEGPSTWSAYFKQQMRWAYGLMDILFRHSPKILPKMRFVHFLNYLFLQHYYFYGLAQFIGIILLFIFFGFGITNIDIDLDTILYVYMPLLIFQQIFFLWSQKFYIDPKNESGLHLHGKLLSLAVWPIYALSFFKVVSSKDLVYQVTPKSEIQSPITQLSLFIPHAVLLLISLLTLFLAFIYNSKAYHLEFIVGLNVLLFLGLIVFVIFTNRINLHKHKVKEKRG